MFMHILISDLQLAVSSDHDHLIGARSHGVLVQRRWQCRILGEYGVNVTIVNSDALLIYCPLH